MALEAIQLNRQLLGPASIAGGLSLLDPLLIGNDKASVSTNWRHRQGVLEFRDQLRGLLTFSPTATGRISRLDLAAFRTDLKFLMALDKAHIWQWNGTGTVFSDITGTSITSGSDTDPWCSDTGGASAILSGDAGFFACNGLNELVYWGGTGNAVKLNGHANYTAVAGNPTNLISRYVACFAGRVVLGYMTEGGNTYSQRLRWCSDSNFFNWNTASRLGAGAVDLLDTGGALTGLFKFSDSLVALKSDSIVFGRETGNVVYPIAFPVTINTGCLSGQSWQAVTPTVAIFLGPDNVYQLAGTEAEPIATEVVRGIFKELNQANLRQIVSFVRRDLQEYYLLLPLSGSNEATRAYVYDFSDPHWWVEDFPTGIHSAATILLGTGATTWDDLQAAGTTWDQLLAAGTSWDSFLPGGSVPRTLIGTAHASSTWRVHQFVADGDYTDTASAMQQTVALWESKTFRLNPQGASTVKGLWLYFSNADGAQVTASVAADNISKQNATRTISSDTKRVFLPMRVTGVFHKVAITTAARLGIRAMEVEYDLRRAVA